MSLKIILSEVNKMNWKKASKKKVEEEFRELLYNIANSNGTKDLIDVCEGFLDVERKRGFVDSWHEQDEEGEV